jgi:hypothetical protein
LKRGNDLVSPMRREAVPLSMTARCAAAYPGIGPIRPIRGFRPFPFTLSVLDVGSKQSVRLLHRSLSADRLTSQKERLLQ